MHTQVKYRQRLSTDHKRKHLAALDCQNCAIPQIPYVHTHMSMHELESGAGYDSVIRGVGTYELSGRL